MERKQNTWIWEDYMSLFHFFINQKIIMESLIVVNGRKAFHLEKVKQNFQMDRLTREKLQRELQLARGFRQLKIGLTQGPGKMEKQMAMGKENGSDLFFSTYMIRVNGNYYEGNFQDGLRNGIGKYHWVHKIDKLRLLERWSRVCRIMVKQQNARFWQIDSCEQDSSIKEIGGGCLSIYFKEYSGMWQNNMMDGEGVYAWQNGNEFRGAYKNDLKNGKGVYKVPNQYGFFSINALFPLEYEGEWLEGIPVNQGKLKLVSAEYFWETRWVGQNLLLEKKVSE